MYNAIREFWLCLCRPGLSVYMNIKKLIKSKYLISKTTYLTCIYLLSYDVIRNSQLNLNDKYE